jgi:riboflavin kinase / FMN adenylyltransferase
MNVYNNIDQLPAFKNAVITIGTFDGVHQGHRLIIEKLKEQARKVNGETVIITFHPHPRKVVSSTILGIRLINTLEEKKALLEQLGIDNLVIVPFTEVFANQPAEDYIGQFLVNHFHPNTIIIGYDHRFGRDRLGNYKMLGELAPVYKYQLKEIPKHVLNQVAISSTKIRESLLHGDLDTANNLLGYNFFFCGEVVHGDKLGRKLGYPTANLKIDDDEKIIPGNGIYAVYAELVDSKLEMKPGGSEDLSHSLFKAQGSLYKGMMSIGFRPTVDGKKRVVEVNIFDFDEEIYGRKLRVFVKKYLRPEIKFNGLPELVAQIDQDKIDSLKIL